MSTQRLLLHLGFDALTKSDLILIVGMLIDRLGLQVIRYDNDHSEHGLLIKEKDEE